MQLKSTFSLIPVVLLQHYCNLERKQLFDGVGRVPHHPKDIFTGPPFSRASICKAIFQCRYICNNTILLCGDTCTEKCALMSVAFILPQACLCYCDIVLWLFGLQKVKILLPNPHQSYMLNRKSNLSVW